MSTLSIASLSTAVPDMFTIPVAFDPQASSVAGIQFDFVIPSGTTLQSVSLGPVGTAASKQLSTSVVGAAERVIIFGLNQTLILAGIAANLNLVATAAGTPALILQNAVATDPNGAAVPLQTSGGTLTIASENPTVATTLAQLQTDLIQLQTDATTLQAQVTAIQTDTTNVQTEVNAIIPLANPDVTAEDQIVTSQDTVIKTMTSALQTVDQALQAMVAALKVITGK